MADYAMGANDNGAFEKQLQAGVPYVIAIGGRHNYIQAAPIQVIHHSGTSPVYVRQNDSVAVADPKADIVMPSSWADLDYALTPEQRGAETFTVALISATAATVSVVRR